MHAVREKKPNKSELEQALNEFDKQKNGFINYNELKKILMTIGDIITEEDYAKALSNLKIPENGLVKKQEIVKALL